MVLYKSTAELRTQLSVLRAVRFANPAAQQGALLQLHYLALTHDTMEALRELPEWSGTISFKHCDAPLATEEYRKLAEVVPVSYRKWVLPTYIKSSLVDSICAGINARREGLGLPPVQATVFDRVSTEGGKHVRLEFSFERGQDVLDWPDPPSIRRQAQQQQAAN